MPINSKEKPHTEARMKHESKDPRSGAKLEGRYANYFKVGHNAFEFLLDFGQFYLGEESHAIFHSRIITSPSYAKRLLEALQNSIEVYEAAYGNILNDDQRTHHTG